MEYAVRVAYDVTVSARAGTGVGVYARSLFEALRARSVDLRVLRYPLIPGHRRLHRLVNGVRLTAWLAQRVHRHIEAENAAVYHSTTSLGPLRRRQPVVITVHDATQTTMPLTRHPAEQAFQRVFVREAVRRADAVLAPTHAAARTIEDVYGIPASRIRVSPLGIDEAFRNLQPGDAARVRETYGLTFPYVLYAGAQVPRKNLHRLVTAFAALPAVHADVRLVLAGPAGRRDRTLTAAIDALRIAHRVRQIDVALREDLPGLYAGAACVAYVSIEEGFGLPIVEAMAARTPVITSDRSSMPEVAGDAAILVDPFSVDAIAAALDRVLTDSALACDMRRRGLQRSREFDWSTTAAVTEQTYRDIAGS